MSSKPATEAASLPDVFLTESARQAWQLFKCEITTYRRELPRLIQEGQANRHALIKGEAILGIWDRYEEASQAGYDRYGLDDPFLIQKIDPRDPDRFAQLDARIATQCPQ